MAKERADLGFADALEEFDPAEWNPKARAAANAKPPQDETRKAAAAAGFRSREPSAVASSPEPAAARAGGSDAPRRRRTGRNAQFNLKARPETIEAFCAIADRQGWGLGETLEKAVELLEQEFR
jgi:hypothetical protein